ncbi:GtrA family protein [Bacillus zhangzhouensis]|nr:GtrA family protein [Bacillus zhangzhouensis]
MKKDMYSLFQKYREVVMYLVMGVCTTIVNIVSFYLFIEMFSMDYKTATVVSWVFAVLFAYITNKKYVFQQKARDKKSLMRELSSFFSVRLMSLGVDLGLMILFVSQMALNETAAKILVNFVIVVVNYAASKWFVFKKTKEDTI